MIKDDIYDPLTEYVNVFRDRFKDVAEATFAELADEAKVDVEANRETCRKIYSAGDSLESLNSRIRWWTFWTGLLVALFFAGIISFFFLSFKTQPLAVTLVAVYEAVFLIYLFMRIRPHTKELNTEKETLTATIEELKNEAWSQMEPLNSLYDWDVLTRMMSKTVPRLEFDPYFTLQRLADLQYVYKWDNSFNEGRSVLYSQSGLINGNPFVICRTKKMRMGQKTYTGSRTISYSSRERGSDGNYHTVQHTQTLTASVTAPYPEYFEKTRLIYGNKAAPDLIFSRTQNGLAGKEGTLSFKMKKRSLRKKARDLQNNDFAMMTNEDFEVAFNTSDRNNNQQFALLFTPLAQESMLKLLKDEEYGYGDDFNFKKERMINMVVPNHLQELDLEMDPDGFRHFDYDKAQANFYEVSANSFRAIYFSLAPLLCVPMYQQVRPESEIYGIEIEPTTSFWEHEAIANSWGEDVFRADDCVTDCILKTERDFDDDTEDESSITVYAHGYTAKQRVTYVRKMANDGRSYNVAVYWDEYIPVTGTGSLRIKEDNYVDEKTATYTQRREHIKSVFEDFGSGGGIYRRHVASKLQ